MSLALAAGTVSSVIFAASNLPMLIKARRTRDLSSYSLAYLVLNNVGNLLYCLYVYDLPPGPIWAMQSFYLLSMALLLRWYLRFTPPRRARRVQPRYSRADAQPSEVRRPVLAAAAHRKGRGLRSPMIPRRVASASPPPNRAASRGMSNSGSWHRYPRDRPEHITHLLTKTGLATRP